MKSRHIPLFLGTGLALVSLSHIGFAADPPHADALRVNYQIEIEILPKNGEPQRLKVVTTGERVHGSYVLPQAGEGEVDTPTIVKFEAELEPLTSEKIWVRTFNLGQQMPIVTGVARSAFGGPTREGRFAEPGTAPDGGGVPADRARTVERRVVEGPPGDVAPAPRSVPRGLVGPGGMVRQMQYMDTGTMSSAILTLGKPLNVIETPMQRVNLTIRKLD